MGGQTDRWTNRWTDAWMIPPSTVIPTLPCPPEELGVDKNPSLEGKFWAGSWWLER